MVARVRNGGVAVLLWLESAEQCQLKLYNSGSSRDMAACKGSFLINSYSLQYKLTWSIVTL